MSTRSSSRLRAASIASSLLITPSCGARETAGAQCGAQRSHSSRFYLGVRGFGASGRGRTSSSLSPGMSTSTRTSAKSPMFSLIAGSSCSIGPRPRPRPPRPRPRPRPPPRPRYWATTAGCRQCGAAQVAWPCPGARKPALLPHCRQSKSRTGRDTDIAARLRAAHSSIALSDFLGEVNPRTPYFLNEARARRYTFARTHIDVDHLNGE